MRAARRTLIRWRVLAVRGPQRVSGAVAVNGRLRRHALIAGAAAPGLGAEHAGFCVAALGVCLTRLPLLFAVSRACSADGVDSCMALFASLTLAVSAGAEVLLIARAISIRRARTTASSSCASFGASAREQHKDSQSHLPCKAVCCPDRERERSTTAILCVLRFLPRRA